jgi:hypothetical protein
MILRAVLRHVRRKGRDETTAERLDALLTGGKMPSGGREAAAALTWAFERITDAGTRRAIVVVDDVDRLDASSLRALQGFASTSPSPWVRLLLTAERAPAGLAPGLATVAIKGLDRVEAERRLRDSNGGMPLVRDDDDIEPLYLDQLARWARTSEEPAPIALADLIDARIRHLGASARRALQSVAVTGGGTFAEASAALKTGLVAPPGADTSACTYLQWSDAPEGVRIMTAGGRIARIDVNSGSTATADGARVGDTEQRIDSLYKGRVVSSPHKYTKGHYLTVSPVAKTDSTYRIVFETDGQRVTKYRAGRRPEVELVEGCG